MSQPDYVRVKDPVSGAEYSVTREQLEVTGLTEADVIDKPALGVDGLPAPAKPRMPLGEPLPGSAADRKRTAKKTATKKTAAKKADGKPPADSTVPDPSGAPGTDEHAGAPSADTEKES